MPRPPVSHRSIDASRQFSKRSRDHLKASHLLDRLIDHFHGKITLTSSQIVVGLKLINKVLPDLRQIDVTATVEHKVEITRETLTGQLVAMGHDPDKEWAQLERLQ